MANCFTFQWENISVTVTQKQLKFFKIVENHKYILNNVSGFGNSNSLIALFGPSGCGKTTLLGALSGRIGGKKGTLKINNRPVSNKYVRNISGYIQQEDKFTESLTVNEHMNFMTALKLHKTNEERREKIKSLLTELRLEEHGRTILALLSGGERRRLSLATELISDPYILFCDEPTTGLDSFSALSVIRKLEDVANNGKLIFISVHQPSSQLFDLFNNLILLASGRLIFQGSKSEAKQFFESANLHCPVSFNPADFYMKCLSIDPNNERRGEEQINRLHDLFVKNYLEKRDQRNGWKNDVLLPLRIRENLSQKNYCLQLDWLVWREYISWKRNLRASWIGYLVLLVTSLVLSVSFSSVELKDYSSVQNIQGALFLIISELIYTHIYKVVYVFPAETYIFLREKSVYSSFPYFFSKLLSLIPGCFLNSVTFLLIYWVVLKFMTGFQLFFGALVILFCTSLCGMCLGLCLSGIFPSIEYMELFIMPVDLLVMIMSGLWIKVDTIPKVFSFVRYLSPFYFGFTSISTLFWEKVDHLANCTAGNALPCYENGKEVLIRFGFFEGYNMVLFNIFCMCGLMLAYCYIGYLGLIRRRALNELY